MPKEQDSQRVSCSPRGPTVGRRDRPRMGAVCPLVRWVSGVGDHSMGDRPRPAPVWETARLSVTPAPTAVLRLCPTPGGCSDTPERRLPCTSSPGPDTPAAVCALRSAPGLPPPAAGIDLGAAEHGVAVPPGCAPQPGRRFGTCTADLEVLADWLLDCGVPTVAMASTGVDWIPVFALLEARGVQVLLIDPRQAKRAPGRLQTARLDGQWRQRLPASGLLAGACRPDDQVCVLRRSLRHRQRLLTSAAHHRQHMHKALPQMNRKRTPVVSALTGVTGMAMLKAIVAGARHPVTLAKLRTPHGQDEDAIAKALQGPWRAEPLLPYG